MKRGKRQIVMAMIILDQPPGQVAHGVIIDVDQRRDAFARFSLVLRGLLHAGAGKIADRLGAVLIAVLGDHGVELLHQIVVKRDGDALHGVLLGRDQYDDFMPFSRPAEALEVVPGLIVTQHSGDGKASQYFLRGFNAGQLRQRRCFHQPQIRRGKTEFFLNAGEGFHSNDARGMTITESPVDGSPLQASPFLVRTKGAEVGLRTK